MLALLIDLITRVMMSFRLCANAVSSLLPTSMIGATNPLSQIQHLITFGDSYTVQNVRDGLLQY